MSKANNGYAVEQHFEGKEPIVRQIYERVLQSVRHLGSVKEEPKKTSIHLVNVTALAGVATRKNALILTIKSDRELASSRIHKSERASAHRFHHEVKLTSPAEVDAELKGWLREAYRLSA